MRKVLYIENLSNSIKLSLVFISLILTISPVLSAYMPRKAAKEGLLDQHVVSTPAFDDLAIREIRAEIGQTVLLPCTVRSLGDKVVSWIRTKDLHILTSGTITFSADNRFESVSSTATNFWGLRLRGVRLSDSGRYECQVNTDPKMSLSINLIVAGLQTQENSSVDFKWTNVAKIKGPSEVYIKEGAPVTFVCEISAWPPSSITSTPRRPSLSASKAYLYWLHDAKQISFDSGRSGISVEMDYRDRNSVSRLRLAEVSPQDGGLYTCSQASAKSASVRLIVVEAEHTEAMQHDQPHSSTTKHRFRILLLFLEFLYLFTSMHV